MSLSGRRPLPTIIESAGIRYNGESDFVELLNPSTGEWEEWERAGVALENCTIVVGTKNLNGETVTCVVGGKTYTGIFVGGSCTFTVREVGVATITSAGYTATTTTVSGGNVSVDLSRPPATLMLTTENLNGEIVTVKIDGVTYTGTFKNSEYGFTIYEVGTATITCGVVSLTCEIVEGNSYTVDVTRDYAVLNFSTSDLDGKTITVSVGGKTYTGTFSSKACSITVYTFGTATITCGYASETLSVNSGQSYNVTLNRPYATINFTTTNLNGHTVTVVCGGSTYTGTFKSNKCTIKIYDVFGSATITSTGVSTSLTVAKGKTYTKELIRPYATLNLTTENLNGELITVTVGGSTYTGTFASNKCTIILYTFGTATITCSETVVEQVVASGGTYTVDVTEETAIYFLQDGYEVNGADISSEVSYGNLQTSYKDGYRFFKITSGIPISSATEEIIRIPFSSDMIGKTVEVVAHPTYTVNKSNIFLRYPTGKYATTEIVFDSYDSTTKTFSVTMPNHANSSGSYWYIECFFVSNSTSYAFKDICIK